jgi:regulatory protein
MVRFVDSGDESDVGTDDGLAPVIPLFGVRAPGSYPKTAAQVQQTLDRLPGARTPSRPAEDRATGDDRDGAPAADAPTAEAAGASTADPVGAPTADSAGAADAAAAAEAAEQGLVKKLRSRQLSVSEARTHLIRLDVDADAADGIIDAFIARGYLDDARLAEQIVHAGVDRKGQGRQVIAQSLVKRGVPRDVVDAALAELPDDDAERALAFARSKAGSMRGLDRDVALRRLAGQLARRGYGGSVALSAARTALDETTQSTGRVRFEER